MMNKSFSFLKSSTQVRSVFIFLCVSFLLIGILYINTLKVPFLFDDIPNIVENDSLHWTKSLSLSKVEQSMITHRPLSNLTFGLNYYFGRLNVRGYHLVNIFLHLLNSLLLFYFLKLTFNLGLKDKDQDHSDTLAMIISLLWAASPLQTQAVNYIVQRMTLLACLFYLLSLIVFIKARISSSKQSICWLILTFLFGLMAFLSKENTAMLPASCLLYDYFFISKFNWNEFKRISIKALPFYFLIGIFIFIYLLWHPDIKDIFFHRSTSQEFTIGERIMTEWRVIVYYLSLLLFPSPDRLSIDYLYPVSKSLIKPVTTLTSLMLIIFIIGWAVKRAKESPLISFGILWFFLNLLVESTFIPIDLVFEHRLYLPSIGFFITLVLLSHRLYLKMSLSRVRAFGFSFILCILFFEGYFTIERNKDWTHEEVLWSKVIQKYPDLARAHLNLGQVYETRAIYTNAEQEYIKTIELQPNNASIHNNYGAMLWKKGNLAKAKEEFNKTLNMDQNISAAQLNLGRLYGQLGNFDKGMVEIRQVLEKHPENLKATIYLGELYEIQNKMDQARERYLKALRQNPDNPEVLIHLGIFYTKTGKFHDAEIYYKHALLQEPESDELHNGLGVFYQNQGLLNQALEEYITVYKLNPNNRTIHYNIGSLFQQEGNIEAAVSEYEKGAANNPMKEALSLFTQADRLTKDPILKIKINQLINSVSN